LAGSAARAAEDKTSREYRSRARAFVAFMSEHRGNGIENLSQKPRIIQSCEQNCADMSRTCLGDSSSAWVMLNGIVFHALGFSSNYTAIDHCSF